MSGPRVAARLDGLDLSLIRKVQLAAAPDAVNLGLGEPTLPTPEPVCRAVQDYLGKGAVRYSLTAGELALRKRLAARYPLHGGGPESVLVTTGSQEALAVAALGLLDPGDEILVPAIAYPAYESLARITGSVAVRYATPRARRFRPAAADIAARITPRARLVLLGSPANPTGAVAEPADVEALERLAEERDLYILSDEIYADIYLGDAPPRQPRGPRTLVISGLSKSHAMTGLRLGWLVAPPAMAARLLPLHQQLVLCASTVAQIAGHAALDLGDGYLAEVRQAYRQRWDALHAALRQVPGIAFDPPDGAFYLLADVRDRLRGTSSLHFAMETARSGGVVVVPGECFGDDARGTLRISYAGSPEDITEGIRRLGLALDRLPA